DGRRLAFVVSVGSAGSVHTKELDDGPGGQLSPIGDNAHSPSWTPDGQSVFYVNSFKDSSALMRRRADGSQPPERLMKIADQMNAAMLSPNGEWIVYSMRIANGKS